MSEETLQIAEKRREAKGKGQKGKVHPSECRVPKSSRRDKKAFSEQCKEIEGSNRMGKTKVLFKYKQGEKTAF